jgi:hypothetical protein
MNNRPYELTVHAAAMLQERGIAREWVDRVFSEPERDIPHAEHAELRHAIGRVPEHGGRWLRVVYNSSTNPVRVVTACFDRSLRAES